MLKGKERNELYEANPLDHHPHTGVQEEKSQLLVYYKPAIDSKGLVVVKEGRVASEKSRMRGREGSKRKRPVSGQRYAVGIKESITDQDTTPLEGQWSSKARFGTSVEARPGL